MWIDDKLSSMKILVTGASGFVGSTLIPRLAKDGHELRALAREPKRVTSDIEVVRGDVVSGAGLAEALEGIDVAYYLVHSMESGSDDFSALERTGAENFATAATAARVDRTIYLGGLVPDVNPSPHLASRLAVEQTLLSASPNSVAFRSSVVIGARSRSFRFLVRLVERVPVLALPPWRDFKTRPIDERDLIELLARAASSEELAGLSVDAVGPETVTYGEMIERIADLMLVRRPPVRLRREGGAIGPIIAAAIAGEDPGLIGPLMAGLSSDLLPREMTAEKIIDIRLHSFDSAVEHALAEWERVEPLAAH